MTVYFQTTFILHYVGKNTALKNGYFKLNPLNLCVCVCVCKLQEVQRMSSTSRYVNRSQFTQRTKFLIPLHPIGFFSCLCEVSDSVSY